MTFTKTIAKTLIHDLGGIHGVRLLNGSGIRILMYHRFLNKTDGLNEQCELIRRHYHPVSLTEVTKSIRNGDSLRRNAVAITIDDGYRDFLEAQEVFRKFEIPATVFLVSDFLDNKLWLWFDKLKFVLRRTKKTEWTTEVLGATLPLNNDGERTAARAKISDHLKSLENSERIAACDQIAAELDVDLPASPPEEFAPLTWDEVRSLAKEGVEFGPHTRTHPILSSLHDPANQVAEIAGSKQRLEAELQAETIHFCYPNGRKEDFNDNTLEIVKQCGFQSAVTTERGMNFAGADPFLLRRLGVEPNLPPRYFEELLSGIRKE
jgi:peptidoglycan/xylan/chitin deacetylase (PgdA/CDA1 family)